MKNIKITYNNLIVLFTWFKDQRGFYKRLNVKGFFEETEEVKNTDIDLSIECYSLKSLIRVIGEFYDSKKITHKYCDSVYNMGESGVSKGVVKMLFSPHRNKFSEIEHSDYKYFYEQYALSKELNYLDCTDWEYMTPDKIQANKDFLTDSLAAYQIVSKEFSNLFSVDGVDYRVNLLMQEHPIHKTELDDSDISEFCYRDLMKEYIQDKNLV